MSPATLEPIVTEKSAAGFYSDVPALKAYHSASLKPIEPHSYMIELPHLTVFSNRPRHRIRYESPVATHLVSRHDCDAQTSLQHIVFEACDTTGNVHQRLSQLVSELASRPRSYSREVAEDLPAKHGAAQQSQAVTALLTLDFSEPDDEDSFPHSALRSFSQDEGSEIERILARGAPDWVRERRQQLGR